MCSPQPFLSFSQNPLSSFIFLLNTISIQHLIIICSLHLHLNCCLLQSPPPVLTSLPPGPPPTHTQDLPFFSKPHQPALFLSVFVFKVQTLHSHLFFMLAASEDASHFPLCLSYRLSEPYWSAALEAAVVNGDFTILCGNLIVD